MNLIDTHSHLYDRAFDGDRAEAVGRALGAGVRKILLPAIDSESHEALFGLARTYPGVCFPMMGLHPTSVNDNPRWRQELEAVGKYLQAPPEGIGRFCAVGEVGIDLYWSKEWAREQMEAFERQIELSLEHGLPLVIHTRAAWKEMAEMLGRFRGKGLRGVMHAYSGEYGEYRQIKEYGDFLFGIGGVVTYKNSGLAEVLGRMSVEDIVLETDCPYLTPVPFRGKRNESSYITYIRDKVAEIYRMPAEEVAEVTTRNAGRMFGV